MALQQEQEHYEQVKEELLKHHEGKFALVYNADVVGIWDSRESAYRDGTERFGNVPFLIKRIVPTEPVETAPILSIGSL